MFRHYKNRFLSYRTPPFNVMYFICSKNMLGMFAVFIVSREFCFEVFVIELFEMAFKPVKAARTAFIVALGRPSAG